MNVSGGRPYLEWTEAMGCNLRPGSRIAVQSPGGGLVYHTITGIDAKTGDYIPAPPLSRRARIIRTLTPRRWRKPLPMGTREPYSVQLTTEPCPTSGGPPSPASGTKK